MTAEELRVAFIIGQHRSGTTMLRSIFDEHPRIAATPEIYDYERMWGRRALTSRASLGAKLARHFDVAEPSKDDMYRAKSWRNLLIALAQGTVAKDEYDLLVMKTPMNVYFVDVLMNDFPSAEIIYIMRDGREICASAVKKWVCKGAIPMSVAARWVLTVRMYERKLARYPHYFLRYEDVTANPTTILNKLFGTLGFSYKSAYGDAVGTTSSFSDTQHRGIYQSKHYQTFFDERTRRRLEGLLKPYLERYGYTLEFDTHDVPLGVYFLFWYHYSKHVAYFTLSRVGLRSAWRVIRLPRTLYTAVFLRS